jgi:hypothetical protein
MNSITSNLQQKTSLFKAVLENMEVEKSVAYEFFGDWESVFRVKHFENLEPNWYIQSSQCFLGVGDSVPLKIREIYG